MKKSTKWILCFLTALAVSGTAALAACSPTEKESEQSHIEHIDENGDNICDVCGENMGGSSNVTVPEYATPSQDYTYWAGKALTKGELLKEDVTDKEITYQFSSTYTQEGYGTYYMLINMYADGYVRVYQYRGYLFEYAGYWVNDGADLGLWVGVCEYGMGINGLLSIYTYNYSNSLLYSDDATFTFTYSISLGGADGGIYVRAVEFNNQTGEVEYATSQDWVVYVEQVTGESFELLDFTSWTGNDVQETLVAVTMTATDGSGTTRDVLFYDENEYDFGGLGGTWSIEGASLILSQDADNGAEWIVTANDDGSYTLTYDYHNEDGTVFSGTLSAEDFQVLSSSQVATTVTLRFGGNVDGYAMPMEFYTNGTFSIQSGTVMGTWSVENGTLVFSVESLTYDAATATITLNSQVVFSAVLTAEQQEALGLTV